MAQAIRSAWSLPRASSSSHLARPPVTIGIRREDPKRIWERRSPLTPDAVHHLVSEGNIEVHVESCDRRVFPDNEYIKVGLPFGNDLLEGLPSTRLDHSR